jgi:hypothetical protein
LGVHSPLACEQEQAEKEILNEDDTYPSTPLTTADLKDFLGDPLILEQEINKVLMARGMMQK